MIVHLPLYPGAVDSTTPIPNDTFQNFPAAYRKLSIAEFAIPAGYTVVSDWYGRSIAACGYVVNGTSPLQQHGGPPFAALFFLSRDGLRSVSLTFRPVSRYITLVRYLVQVLDLPPRPSASFLYGPFVRVSVLYHSQGVMPASHHVYRFTINWQPTITRVMRAVNGPIRIYVPSSERTDGGIRQVRVVNGPPYDIVVDHSRPLVDINGQLLRLVDRLGHARCHPTHGCS